VVGVSTFGLQRDGLNFALSSRYVRELLGEMIIKPPSSTHLCPSCGARNSASRRRCRKCGVSFESPPPPAAVPDLLGALEPPPTDVTDDAFTWRDHRVTFFRAPESLRVSIGAAPLTLDAAVPRDLDARRFAALLSALIDARLRVVAAW
jgi:hypothetical protein